jgi:hypothetical protein
MIFGFGLGGTVLVVLNDVSSLNLLIDYIFQLLLSSDQLEYCDNYRFDYELYCKKLVVFVAFTYPQTPASSQSTQLSLGPTSFFDLYPHWLKFCFDMPPLSHWSLINPL